MSFKIADAFIDVDADLSKARRTIESGLRGTTVKVEAKADTTKAKADVQSFVRDASGRLNSSSGTFKAKADTSDARRGVAEVEAGIRKVDGRTAHTSVDLDIGAALLKIGILTTALGGISAAAAGIGAVAVAGVGAVAGLGAVVGAGLGSVMVGVSGVGGALKAMSAAEAEAASSAGRASAQHKAMESAIAGVKRASEQVADAERRHQDSLAREKQAQMAVADAYEAARRRLEDLQRQTEDMALSQEGAAISVARAQEALAKVNKDGEASALDRREAEFRLAEALQRQKEVAQDATRLAVEKAAADKAGVKGSDEVTAANKRVAEAHRGVEDSQRAVTRAAEGLAEAQANVRDVSQQAGQQGSSAAAAMAKAWAALTPAGREFAVFLKSFIDGPLKDFKDAGQQNLLPGLQAGLQQVKAALPGVTQEFGVFSATLGRALGDIAAVFVDLGPSFFRFSDAALQGLSALMPVLQDFVDGLGEVFDRLADTGQIQAAMSGFAGVLAPVLDLLVMLVDAGVQTMAAIGDPLARALNNLVAGLGPLLDGLPGIADGFGRVVDVVSETVSILSGPLGGVLRGLTSGLAPVLDALPVFAAGVGDVLDALSPLLPVIGRVVAAVASALGPVLSGLSPVIETLVGAIDGILGALEPVLPVIGDALAGAVEAVAPLIEQFAGLLLDIAQTAGPLLSMMFQVIGENLSDLFGALSPVIPAFQELFDAVKPILPVFAEMMAMLSRLGTQVLVKVVEGLAQWIAVGARFYAAIIEKMSPALIGFMENMAKSVELGLIPMLNAIDAVFGAIGKFAGFIGNLPGMEPFKQALKDASTDTGGLGLSLDGATGSAGGFGGALDGLSPKVKTLAERQQELVDKSNAVSDAFLSGRDAESAYYAAVDDATAALEENGKTLDVHTEKGRANRGAIDDLAQAANDYTTKLQDQGATEQVVQRHMDESRAKLIELGVQFGMTDREAAAYADQVLKIPAVEKGNQDAFDKTGAKLGELAKTSGTSSKSMISDNTALSLSHTDLGKNVDTQWTGMKTSSGTSWKSIRDSVLLPFKAAVGELGPVFGAAATAIGVAWNQVKELARAPVVFVVNSVMAPLANAWNSIIGKVDSSLTFPVPKMATGGPISGPGGGTDDKVPIWASNREWIIRAGAADAIGPLGMAMINMADRNGLRVSGDTGTAVIGKYADGGLVTSTQNWLRGITDKPYVWGGVGPDGWDCSGLTGTVYAMLTGRAPYQRYFTTTSFLANPGNWGFAPGTGTYTVGVSPSHTVGNLGGLAFEAPHSGANIRVGGSAQSTGSVGSQYYLEDYGAGPAGSVFDPVALAKTAAKAVIDKLTGGWWSALSGMGFFGDAAAAIGKKLVSSIFDDGGMLKPGTSLVSNMSGSVEPVLSPGQWETIREMVRGIAGKGGSGGPTYVFHQGAFTLDASRIRSVEGLISMIEKLSMTARAYGAGV